MRSFIIDKISDYNNFVIKDKYYSLWQSLDWKNFQESIGRKTFIIGVKEKGEIILTALVIKHDLPWNKSFFEIPRGPLGDLNRTSKYFFGYLKALSKKENAIFCKFNPFNKYTTITSKKISKDTHPEKTLTLNLELTEEALLKQMKQKGRYNIKLADKKGVKICESNDITKFVSILKETTNRDKFSSHDKNYYKSMIDTIDSCKLYLAQYNGTVIAGGIFCFVGDRAIYYYGASSNKYRNLMAPYLLLWHSIKEAKKNNLKIYDFLGIPDHLKGVKEFKLKFGGEIEIYPQTQVIIFSWVWYIVYITTKWIKKHL